VCGFTRESYDDIPNFRGPTFDEHKDNDHYFWNYAYFYVYLKQKKKVIELAHSSAFVELNVSVALVCSLRRILAVWSHLCGPSFKLQTHPGCQTETPPRSKRHAPSLSKVLPLRRHSKATDSNQAVVNSIKLLQLVPKS
jgi:hypothetical protein